MLIKMNKSVSLTNDPNMPKHLDCKFTAAYFHRHIFKELLCDFSINDSIMYS